MPTNGKQKFILVLEDEKQIKAIGPYTSHKKASQDKIWLTNRKIYKSVKILALFPWKELYPIFEKDATRA